MKNLAIILNLFVGVVGVVFLLAIIWVSYYLYLYEYPELFRDNSGDISLPLVASIIILTIFDVVSCACLFNIIDVFINGETE